MKNTIPQADLLYELKERAKELNCLYLVQEILNQKQDDSSILLNDILDIIPGGFQFPEICKVNLIYEKYTPTYQKTLLKVPEERSHF